MGELGPISNMKEMKDTLQAYLLKTENLPEDDEKGNEKKIKTYIIESNISDPGKIKKTPKNTHFSKTEDPKLFQISVPSDHQTEMLYFDCSDPRFWLVHSAGKSDTIKNFIKEIVTSNRSYLDYSWYSSNFLENNCKIGHGTGFGIRYENSFLKNETEVDEKYLRRFSMLFWGGRPSDVLVGLKSNSELVSGVTLSSVRRILKTEAGFVKESIGHKGTFLLTKGDSIDSHLLAVDNVKNEYSNLISNIEQNYRINYLQTDSGVKVNGTYSLIKFGKRIEDLDFFLKNFVSCTNPFRLFGLPQFVDKDFVKVSAVDLHNYHKFNMELTPDYIRIFLYPGGCGNVIARLMTNLQHYYDSQVKLIGCDDEQLI